MFENQKKRRKYENKRNVYINLHLKDRLGHRIHSCLGKLIPEEPLTSFTVSDAYR